MKDKLFERWRKVGRVQVSNYGRIRKDGRLLRQQRWGRTVSCKVNGKTRSVPRLVAHAWLGLKPNDSRQVRRKRGRSNAATNLYLARLRGEEIYRHKLTESEVLTIFHSDKPQAALMAEFGVTQSCISAIQCRRTWVWLTKAATR